MPAVSVEVHPELRFLLAPRRRRERFTVHVAATDTVGHVVQMLGVPLTEVGALALDGQRMSPTARLGPSPGSASLVVGPRPRPQTTRCAPPRFVLDVHLGSLARRLRLLGLDTAYVTEAEDEELVRQASDDGRVLLSRDRGLLSRSALAQGALVRGDRTEDQLDDVLERFAPLLAPWTRCPTCNAPLAPTDTSRVSGGLRPGTLRTYRDFSRCTGCGQVYWRGAHSRSLERIVARAEAVVARAGSGPSGGGTGRRR